MIYSHFERFHNKSQFYSNFIQFWLAQSSFPIVEKFTKINHKKNPRALSTFDFSTLYTVIAHNLLIKVLNEIIFFVFNYKKKA